MFSIIIISLVLIIAFFASVVAVSYQQQVRAMATKPSKALQNLDEAKKQKAIVLQRRAKIKEKIHKTDAQEEGAAGGKNKVSWDDKLHHAGIKLSIKTFMMYCGVATAGAAGLLVMFETAPQMAVPLAFFLCFVLPFLYVNTKFNRNIGRFNDEFISALEVIVRGVRTGLPLNECFKIISVQCAPPVCDEFLLVLKDMQMGMSVAAALMRMRQRIPLSSVALFATTIAIQQKTGGSLSDVLAGLVELLRGKKMLRGKVRAVSSQAKASALIMSAMPIIIIGALQVLNPDHLQPLLHTSRGHQVLVGVAVWMGIGMMIMNQMTKIVKED